MKWLSNIRITTRLVASFLIVALLAGAVGIVGVVNLRIISSDYVTLFSNYGNTQGYLGNVSIAFMKWRMYMRDLVLERTADSTASIVAMMKDADDLFTENLALYEATCDTPQEKQEGQNMADALNNYKTFRDKMVTDAQAGKYDDAYAILRSQDSTDASVAAEKLITDVLQQNVNTGNGISQADHNTSERTVWILIVISALAVVMAVVLGLIISRSIGKPIAMLVGMAKKLAAGDTDTSDLIASKDEVGILARAMGEVVAAIRRLIDDANMLSHAAVEGRLSTRADSAQHQGDYRAVIVGVNSTLDAVINPLGVAADYVQRISCGDIPPKITGSYKGDFHTIKDNLNTCIDAINRLISDTGMLSAAAVEGRLDARAGANTHQGDFRRIVEGVNATLDAVISPLNVAADYVQRISRGNIPEKITDSYSGDFNTIKNNLNTCIDAVNLLVSDTNMLSAAAVEGRLDARADATRHQGDFRKIVEGVNASLDSVITPINESLEVMKRFAVNDYTVQMQGQYAGVPLQLAQGINATRDRMLVIQGVFEDIAAGDTSKLEHFLSIRQRSENDRMMPAVIGSMSTVEAMVDEANRLSAAAMAGKLDARSDAMRFQGKYRLLIEGINGMMDAMVTPLRQSAQAMRLISRGDLSSTVTAEYHGEFNDIKNDLNTCVAAIRGLIDQMNHMSAEHEAGDIDVRLDGQRFEGAYRQMAQGINAMVEGHIAIKKKAMACVAEFGRGNFDAPLERFPGKKAFINENIEQVRANLKALIEDANHLAEAAMEGRLEARADATRHNGDFRKIIGGMNNTLDAIAAPLNEAQEILASMAANDYTTDMSTEYNGSFRTLAESVNHVQETLNEVLGNLASAAEQVASGTRQVSDGSQALSQGATEQASAIEELTASVTEIATQTKQNAMSANQANDIALQTRDSALLGNSQMKEMLQSMSDINESSNNISRIIKVIDDIAFQTNLLALNAAVEAARAGTHGKGFAVVAEEVRNLAARSANAAKETTAMIGSSIQKVEDGTRIANETAHALGKIVEGVEKSNDLVSSIAKASNEQATAVAQVNRGIEQVSQVVQTNSATAEQSAATSEELSGQAELLKEMVSRFRLKRGNMTYSPARATLGAPQSKPRGRSGAKLQISLNDREFGKY